MQSSLLSSLRKIYFQISMTLISEKTGYDLQ